jgi:hypothetical protein
MHVQHVGLPGCMHAHVHMVVCMSRPHSRSLWLQVMIGASDVGSVQPLVKEGDMVTKVRVRVGLHASCCTASSCRQVCRQVALQCLGDCRSIQHTCTIVGALNCCAKQLSLGLVKILAHLCI